LVRILRQEARALSTCELLALVLGPGGREPAILVAARLLLRFGSLADLAGTRPATLWNLPGVGGVRAARLVAALELGARARGPTLRSGVAINRPGDLAPLLAEEFRGCDREHFLGCYLDARHRLQAVETISIGSLNASLVHPREVFRPALALGAAAVLVAHNHPSGCAEPSRDDLELTSRLARCGRLLGIDLLDHLIWGERELVSLRERGWPDLTDRGLPEHTEGF
jgi:DNA repair protein RadC